MDAWRRHMWIAWCAGFAAVAGCAGEAGCSGPQLNLGGGGDSGCVPGIYVGSYDCADASFPVVAPPPGALGFKLQGEPHGRALHIAPGSTWNTETMGVSSVAELSGTLDCTTNKLVGNLSNVMLNSSTFNGTLVSSGDITADYDATADPQALVNGQISFSIIVDGGPFPFPDAAFLFADAAFAIPPSAFGATCTWSAARQP